MLPRGIPSGGHKKANDKQHQDEEDEAKGVLQGAPEAASLGEGSLLFLHLIVFLVPEVGERDGDKAQQGVQRVEGVVCDLQGGEDRVDAGWRGPVLLGAEVCRCGRRDKGNVDRQEENGSEKGGQAEDGDNADGD